MNTSAELMIPPDVEIKLPSHWNKSVWIKLEIINQNTDQDFNSTKIWSDFHSIFGNFHLETHEIRGITLSQFWIIKWMHLLPRGTYRAPTLDYLMLVHSITRYKTTYWRPDLKCVWFRFSYLVWESLNFFSIIIWNHSIRCFRLCKLKLQVRLLIS